MYVRRTFNTMTVVLSVSRYPYTPHSSCCVAVLYICHYRTNLIARNAILRMFRQKRKGRLGLFHLKRICRGVRPFRSTRDCGKRTGKKKKKLIQKTHFEYKHFNPVQWQMSLFSPYLLFYPFFSVLFLSRKLYIPPSSPCDNRNWPTNVHGHSASPQPRCLTPSHAYVPSARVKTPGFSNDLRLVYSFSAIQIYTTRKSWCICSYEMCLPKHLYAPNESPRVSQRDRMPVIWIFKYPRRRYINHIHTVASIRFVAIKKKKKEKKNFLKKLKMAIL